MFRHIQNDTLVVAMLCDTAMILTYMWNTL